ncbi:hypothetical protein CDCA_CDCA04G1309 [Cyanidium caldarium]|uniref:TNase-like domain-containing protein n=1 Tax=Cyanidium caldarium TaxID=2771 RepID=A0AAV9ISR6_CYACA|nr:hypothetical protein CDCA_CDCA04G1309 [Cyanidium caldarium]
MRQPPTTWPTALARLCFPLLTALCVATDSLLAYAASATAAATRASCDTLPIDGLRGKPRIVDGDTLELNGKRVRLFAIDAFESTQLCPLDVPDTSTHRPAAIPCGREATTALQSLIGEHEVACECGGVDFFGRYVGVCRLDGPEDIDLNREMVRSGWALAFRNYSLRYVPDEQFAQAHRRGSWAYATPEHTSFEAPWEWRRHHRRPLRAKPDGAVARRHPVVTENAPSEEEEER